MNILMVTNVYTPQIGGVTRSVQQYSDEFRRQGHQVLIIAPEYEETPQGEPDVIRVAAIPNFYQHQYSLPLPVFSRLLPDVKGFQPDIVHVHHPFLLGSTGQLISADRNVPLVYTHHTRYSVYMETKTDWPRPVEEAIVELIIGFCQLCDGIVTPSAGIGELLRQRGVTSRMTAIPTGVDTSRFRAADRDALRQRLSLRDESFIVGHVGRLSPEKNTSFLVQAVAAFLKDHLNAVFVVVGDGPDRESMEQTLQQEGVDQRCHFLGFLEGNELIDAYAGFDVFAFASHSETQGMVLAEAMAAGTPVVAVEATGVSDLVVNGVNGHLIAQDEVTSFVDGLKALGQCDANRLNAYRQAALDSARELSQADCASRMLDFYGELCRHPRNPPASDWERLQQRWEARWQLWKVQARAMAAAARETLNPGDETRPLTAD